ncbi:MAG: LysR family transcriptional regulator [Gammaproteobacteria bacterium]
MNLTHLQYFVRTIEKGSYSRAAREFNVTQPAISTAIKRLEDEFGTQLIVRKKEGIELTAAGKSLLDNARKLLGDAARLQEEIRQINNVESGVISIGLRTHLMTEYVQQAVQKFLQNNPKVHVKLRTGEYLDLLDMLLLGELDMIIDHAQQDRQSEELSSEFIASDPFMVFMRPEHPEAKSKTLPVDIVNEYPHVYSTLLEKRAPRAMHYVRKSGYLDHPPEIDIADQSIMGRLVANSENNYVFIWTFYFFEQMVRSGELIAIPLDGVDWKLSICATYRSEALLSPAARKFIDEMKSDPPAEKFLRIAAG